MLNQRHQNVVNEIFLSQVKTIKSILTILNATHKKWLFSIIDLGSNFFHWYNLQNKKFAYFHCSTNPSTKTCKIQYFKKILEKFQFLVLSPEYHYWKSYLNCHTFEFCLLFILTICFKKIHLNSTELCLTLNNYSR